MLRRWHMLVGPLALVALGACAGPQRGDFDTGPSGDAATDVRRDASLDVPRDVPRDMGVDVRADVRPDIPVGSDVRDVPVTPDSGGRCADTCTVDTDCQTTCPATSSGSSNCCVFNVCTIVAQPACPGMMMMGDGGTCSSTCATSAQCGGCSGGRTCCFLGTCLEPPFGFCPDLGGTDSGTVVTDTGPRDVGIDIPVATDVGTDALPATDTVTATDTVPAIDALPPIDSGSAGIDTGAD